MDNTLLAQLAKRLNLTDLEEIEEEYILSPEEAYSAILHEIESQKKHYAWRRAQMGQNESQIDHNIASIDWEMRVDVQEVLKRANSNAHRVLFEKEQRRKEGEIKAEKQAELIKKCNARYMFWVMSQSSLNNFNKELVVDEDNKHLISTLCFFLSRDKRLETFDKNNPYSMNKGLFIRGTAGLGKTFLVQCLQHNELNPIKILSAIEINDVIRETGTFHVEQYGNHIVYIDDVGSEEAVVKHYGNSVLFFKNFIETMYLSGKGFNRIIVSSNYSFKDIEEKYGFRVRSRIREMFNIVDVKGQDRRK